MKHWLFHLYDICLSQILENSLPSFLWILYLFLISPPSGIPLIGLLIDSHFSLHVSTSRSFFSTALSLCAAYKLIFSGWSSVHKFFGHSCLITLIQPSVLFSNFRDNLFHFNNSIYPFQICLDFLGSVCLFLYFQFLLLHVQLSQTYIFM